MFRINATKKRADVFSTLSSTTWTLGLELLYVSTTYSHYNNTTIYNICQIKKKRTSLILRCSHLKFLERRTDVVLLEDRIGFEPTMTDLQSVALTELGYRSIKGVKVNKDCNN